jgi:hypothetical protein
LWTGRYSPDARWVSFTARTTPGRAEIVIAPLAGQTPVPESAWIRIAEVDSDDWADWSPDGLTLHFTSSRDGHNCLWAQRLNPVDHRPAGEAFVVLHLHGRLRYQRRVGWSAAAGRIAMVLFEETGNIWMMPPSSDAR